MKRSVDKNKQMKESRNKLVTNYFYFLLMEHDTSDAGVYSTCQQSLMDFFIYEFLELAGWISNSKQGAKSKD